MRREILDRQITFEVQSVEQDEVYGTEKKIWIPFAARVPANVQDVLPSKSEAVKQGMKVANRPARIRMRYLAGITSDMRVVIHGEIDRITQIVSGPAELGRREGIELVVEEYSVQLHH
jgi:head-tail adaptor